jgi:hypothetical protein
VKSAAGSYCGWLPAVLRQALRYKKKSLYSYEQGEINLHPIVPLDYKKP